MKKYNFYAGPSNIAESVLFNVQKDISISTGLSILEVSHRSSRVKDLFDETEKRVRELCSLRNNKKVVFTHGGARMQNCMLPYNILLNKEAAYIDSGLWSKMSIDDAKKIRSVEVIASSSDMNYSFIPKVKVWDGEGYLHITSNNTVNGTQFHCFPKTPNGTLVADMSSDIMSRQIDYDKFGLVYAGLQKNLGCAGGCILIINEDLVEEISELPSMLNYKKIIDAKGMLNTPPVFAVLFCNNVLKWIMKRGGVTVLEKENTTKASILYETIDSIDLYEGYAEKEDRSKMNITFFLKDQSLSEAFKLFINKREIYGLNGHRSKGGFRASIYNMLPLKDVEYLAETMRAFAANH